MVQVRMLKVEFDYAGKREAVYPALVGKAGEALLVDACYPGQLGLLEAALRAAGLEPEDLASVLVSHHDFDHLGALAALKRAHPRLQVLASELEAPYIEGSRKSLRLEQAELREAGLSEAEQAWSRGFRRVLESVEPARVDRLLSDGELVGPGGARVVATPGHTEGHLSLFVEEEGLLVAGDALALKEGELCLANPEFAFDLALARESIKRLARLPIRRILCYHGGMFEGDVKAALARLFP